MVVFPSGIDRGAPPLDFDLLRDGPITMYKSRDVLAKHIDWLEAHGYRVLRMDVSARSDFHDFHAALREAFGFPDWYGMNLNALADSLEDLAIPEEAGLVLAVEGYRADLADEAFDVIARGARWWLLFGRRLLALVQSDDPRLALPRCGGTKPRWNNYDEPPVPDSPPEA